MRSYGPTDEQDRQGQDFGPQCSQCGCEIASCGAYSQDMTSGAFICNDCEPIELRGDIFAPNEPINPTPPLPQS